MRTLPLAIAVVYATACTPQTDLAQILPDDRLLIDEAELAGLARTIGAPSTFWALTHDTTTDINASVREVLAMVDAVTAFDPSWASPEQELALWGPWLEDGVHGQLWVEASADGYTWAVELRPEGSPDDAWTPVLAGSVDAGADADTSQGQLVLDFTAIDDAGAGEGITGGMAVEYELLPTGAEATVYFGDVSEDGSIPQTAGYHYLHEAGNGGQMDLAVTIDIDEPPNGVQEVLILRSRWTATGEGRADALVTEGDLGPLTFTVSECWDASHSVVFEENNYALHQEGDAAACAFAEASFSDR